MKRKIYNLNRREIIKGLFGLGAIVVTGIKLSELSEKSVSAADEKSSSFRPLPVGNKFRPGYKQLDFEKLHLIAPWSG